MESLFVVIEAAGICVIFVALGLLLKGESSREQKLMGYFVCGSLVQNAGYLLELTAHTLEGAVIATKIEYLGSIFVPFFYCWFIFSYCYQKVPVWFLKILGAIDFFVLALIFTCDHHTFYYRKLDWLVTQDGHHYMSIVYGPGYLFFLSFGCIIPYILSVIALIRAIMAKSEHVAGRKYKMILALSVLPLLALLSYVLKLTFVYDITPVTLGLALSSVVILVWSRKIYDFRHLAAETVLYNMGDGVIVLNAHRKIVSYNQAAERVFAKLGSRVAGDSIEGILDVPEHADRWEFGLNNRSYESHVERILDKNGEKQGYVILVLDMTETKNYIEEIKHVREQAEKANLAKSEFLANMSHEIRTPMNAIMGLSDLIMEESRGRKVYTYACDIKSASGNLLTIINDILDLSKVEAGKMELVKSDYYIKTIVNEVVSMMDIAASQHGLVLKCTYDRTLPCQFYGDEGRIKQILINLLNNAVKFTKEGFVKVFVEGRPGETAEEELLVFRVEDTGCGIKQEDLDKIFEDFRQVDSKRNRSVEGTGLGLSITKHLVHLMNGTIEVESTYGKGSAFTVTIPQKIVDVRTLEELPEAPVREEEKIEPFVVEGYHVLVVDDNRINRKVAVGFLKPYGFLVEEASGGAEAVELVKHKKYDIIFMDHMMPGMDGIEAAGIIRRECGENGSTPVIIALTANAMEGVREKFLSSGFQDFLTKPVERKHLNETLAKWIPDSDRKPFVFSENAGQNGANGAFEDICIRGIDVEMVRQLHEGSMEDYLELLKLYCIDGGHKLTLLKELIEKGGHKAYQDYQIEVHGLKSASANIGAAGLSAQAKEHEMAAKRGDIEFIRQQFPGLYAAYEKQLADIREYLEARDGTLRSEEENAPGIDREALMGEIRDALDSLENFQSKECARKIGELLKCHLDSGVRAQLEAVQEQLKIYEDDKAEQLLNQILSE